MERSGRVVPTSAKWDLIPMRTDPPPKNNMYDPYIVF